MPIRGFVLLSLCAVVASASVARADQTGMAGMHAWTKVGGKTCLADHAHFGGSSGSFKSKQAALKDAISSWQGFTAFEYGTDWANFSIAHAKKVSCTDDASGWSCNVEANPCLGKARR
ncbi:MAG: hypothetical protein NW217_13625 [Hyphomicrobiaceae bacterium]|nr:hypothetical protein [Hyphomicrobiaceae bacterium]